MNIQEAITKLKNGEAKFIKLDKPNWKCAKSYIATRVGIDGKDFEVLGIVINSENGTKRCQVSLDIEELLSDKWVVTK